MTHAVARRERSSDPGRERADGRADAPLLGARVPGEEVAEPRRHAVARAHLRRSRWWRFATVPDGSAILDERCPHRLASLALGRNEEGGIRCVYHGWKFDVDGRCIEMPTEPGGLQLPRSHDARAAIPLREAGGLVWTYLGPPGTEPPFPGYDWTQLPKQAGRDHQSRRARELPAGRRRCDRLLALAGFCTATRSGTGRSAARSRATSRRASKCEDEPYGFRYAAIRKPNAEPGQREVRARHAVRRAVHRADPAAAG